ncbi:MAG: alanine racemase [Nitrospinota bacterium]|nr:MAG: alanine racemase [Nitrospinota bacterium]
MQELHHLRRWAWIEVSLEAIAHNIQRIREHLAPSVHIMAVVKANGYGHGSVAVAQTALQAGASFLGVASVGEAVELRAAGISAPILLLGGVFAPDIPLILEQQLTPTLFDTQMPHLLSQQAQRAGKRVPVHIKVDTGMHRLGLPPAEVVPYLTTLHTLPGLQVEGIFTHFAMADARDPSYTKRQIALFQVVLDRLRSRELLPPLVHACNSAGIAWYPEAHYNLVRLGIAMYGLQPSTEKPYPIPLRPALSLKTRITHLQRLPPGSRISYGGTYTTRRETVVATLAIGYADGVRRGPHPFPAVLVCGTRAPVIGRVCMDQMMIDVTDIPGVGVGEEVVLIGQQGKERISAEEVAAQVGTINYEIVTSLSQRPPRLYY